MIINRISNKIKTLKKNKMIQEIVLDVKTKLDEKGVKVIYVEPPIAKKIENLSEFEKERISNWIFNFNNIEESEELLKILYGESYDKEYIQKLFDGGVVIQENGRKRLLDFSNEYVNIVNGSRVTTDIPETYVSTIHMYGTCIMRGTGVEDRQTIASCLQREINKVYPKLYKVSNHGIGRGTRILDDLAVLEETALHKGDVVIIVNFMNDSFLQFCKKNGIYTLETSKLFNRPHNYGEWFTDEVVHTNYIGNGVIAKEIYFLLEKENIIKHDIELSSKEVFYLKERPEIYKEQVNNLQEYLNAIKLEKIPNSENQMNGAIVMNCNPFTLGHRYLIETAAKQVDNLYIFVVEENKSYFTFEDRFDLVRKGTADLANVKVLPSGKFIISAITFPGYFLKDNNKDMIIDASKDVEIFGRSIAPVLDISIRFAGEEPIDFVTRQYNESMNEILPRYGIEFKVIPRKEHGGQVISASLVRKYLEEGALELIEPMVPSTTFEYLKERKYGK